MTREELRFNFLRNALYQTARRRVLEGWGRWANFAVLLLGTAAAGNVLVGAGISAELLGAAVAVVAAMQFVFDFGGRARTHEFLQRRYYEVLAEIDGKPTLTEKECSAFAGKLALLSAEEPPTYRALDAVAYNEAVDAIWGSRSAGDRLVVPWSHDLLRNVWHFNGANYRSRDEVAGAT